MAARPLRHMQVRQDGQWPMRTCKMAKWPGTMVDEGDSWERERTIRDSARSRILAQQIAGYQKAW
ncbi:hypothetical protein BM1_00191 [Bipolaris maydis]|nr:hypothetical protein BM1_00191 [Bipolaris maydis]